jgi:hypothetical protein
MFQSRKRLGSGFPGAFLISNFPFGQNTQPTSELLENTDFTLARGMNLRRRSEAWTRIDAAATQPVFGVLCHQIMPFP